MAEGMIFRMIQREGGVGSSPNLQYFVVELHGRESVRTNYLCVCTSKTTYRRSFVRRWPDEPEDNFIQFPSIRLDKDSPRFVMCMDREAYQRNFGMSNSAPVFEWRDWSSAENLTLLADDFLTLRLRVSNMPTRITNAVAWGDSSKYQMFVTNDETSIWDWPNTCPIPTRGQALVKSTDTNRHTDWYLDDFPIPGTIGAGRRWVWLNFEIPDFSSAIDDDFTSSWPAIGHNFTVTDSTPLDYESVIQVDFEQIKVRKVSKNTLRIIERGFNGTLPASHQSGALLSFVEENGEAHRRQKINSLTVKRKRVIKNNALVVPKTMTLYGSIYQSPQRPSNEDEDSHTDWLHHWQELYKVIDNESTVVRLNAQGMRPRHLKLLIHEMLGGGRAKIDEIVLEGVGSEDIDNGEEGLGIIIRDLLEKFIPSSQIAINPRAFIGTKPNILIAESDLASAIESVAAMAGCIIEYARDGNIQIYRRPTHPLSERPDTTAILDYDEIRAPHQSTHVSGFITKQHRVEIEDPESGEIFIAAFPPKLSNAEVITHQLQLAVSSESDAAMYAEMMFRDDASNLGTYNGETVGPAPWLSPGQRILVRDTSLSQDGGALRQIRIVSVEHGENGVERFDGVDWYIE